MGGGGGSALHLNLLSCYFLPTDQFGCLAWSHSETHLLYVAEKKRPKAESFFKPKAPELRNEEELTRQHDKAIKVGQELHFTLRSVHSLFHHFSLY